MNPTADPPTVDVRRLDPHDRDDCVALAVSRDWGPELRKWSFLFEVGEVYGVRDPAGALVSAAVLARNGDAAATIGMVLTDARHERRGLARAVVSRLVEAAGDAVVTMYATDVGRPLYERLGFVADGVNTTYRGVVPVDPTGLTRRADPADAAAIAALDARAHGVARSLVLDELPAFAESTRVRVDGTRVTGYGAVWRNDETPVIGPVIAEDAETALALVTDLAADVEGPIRVEAHDSRPELDAWARGHGLVGGTTTTMTLHGRPSPGDRSLWWCPVTVALG